MIKNWLRKIPKEMFYVVLIFVLIFVFSALSIRTYNNFQKLVKINEDYVSLIEKYKNEYVELKTKYDNLLEKANSTNQTIELPVYEYTEAEIYTLAQCVEAEAGFSLRDGSNQKYVTQVILNRVQSDKFPNTIKDVIYQKVGGNPQFSVAYNGLMLREVKEETLVNVYRVLLHGTDLPKYVYYFYSDYVTGNWVNTLNTYTSFDGMVFAYSNKDKEDSTVG